MNQVTQLKCTSSSYKRNQRQGRSAIRSIAHSLTVSALCRRRFWYRVILCIQSVLFIIWHAGRILAISWCPGLGWGVSMGLTTCIIRDTDPRLICWLPFNTLTELLGHTIVKFSFAYVPSAIFWIVLLGTSPSQRSVCSAISRVVLWVISVREYWIDTRRLPWWLQVCRICCGSSQHYSRIIERARLAVQHQVSMALYKNTLIHYFFMIKTNNRRVSDEHNFAFWNAHRSS